MPSSSVRRFVRASFVVGLVAAIGVAGCGKGVGTVSGKVSYQGKALKGGSVTFVSAEGGPSPGAQIKEDGTYTVPDVPGGKYKICVTTSFLKPEQKFGLGPTGPKIDPKAPPPAADLPPTASSPRAAVEAHNLKRYVAIPDKYSKPEETDLEYTVTAGDQTHDIDLK
jgi:hypothetical protein